MSDSSSPVGVCVIHQFRKNVPQPVSYPNYLHEILQCAGVPYEAVEPDRLADSLAGLRLLITAGEATLDDPTRRQLQHWLDAGGAWIAVGGSAGAPDLLGVDALPNAVRGFGAAGPRVLGEGYLTPADHVLFAHLTRPLHFFNGLAVRPTTGTVLASCLDHHQRGQRAPGVIEHATGRGRSLFIAPDLTGAVVRIQQGVSITRDGVPAPDGTAPTSDGMLKSDDGMALDWTFDRGPIPGADDFLAFVDPIADQWRELLLRAVFYLCQRQGVALPVLWRFPRNLPAVAHLSHDTDGNDPAAARRMLHVLADEKVNSTWCTILPGYDAALTTQIASAGHELAMHYDAVENDKPFDRAQFTRQKRGLTALFAGRAPVSNKNHYLRWEGDSDFWQWCVEEGIQLDQSKGPSKTGCVGFVFGTCQPHFPVDPHGHVLDVLELPTLTQDLVLTAPHELGAALVDGALRSHGVMHVLFHPAHITKPDIESSLRSLLQAAKERGMEWWTAGQVNRWERDRRQVMWSEYAAVGTAGSVALSAGPRLPTASILWLGAQTIRVAGQASPTTPVTRWGFDFASVTLDLETGQTVRIEAQ